MSSNPSEHQGAPDQPGAPAGAPAQSGAPGDDRPGGRSEGQPHLDDRPAGRSQEHPRERPIRPAGNGAAGLGADAHRAAAAYAQTADAAAAVDDAATGEGEPAGPPAADEGPPERRDVERDLEELTAKAEKAEEYLVLAQRTQADFENFRKRAVRDNGLAVERGIAKLAKELLPAIDNLDRAVRAAETYGQPPATETEPVAPAAAEPLAETDEASAGAGTEQLVSGIRLVHADVLAALSRVGIEAFSPEGEPFDPQHHEAVAQAPVPGAASGSVVEVYQQGYRLGETVLRPARVLVAQ